MYLLELENVCVSYTPGKNAVSNVSAGIRENTITAIMGPSGCGKSTLLNIIGLLDVPTSGRLLVGGIDATTLNDAQMAEFRNKKLGMLPTSPIYVLSIDHLSKRQLPIAINNQLDFANV